ncbi:MAG: hypothetical protein V7L21_07915 [Nostoc sp.]|nr:hypothetical protein [Nostoc sp. NMS9]
MSNDKPYGYAFIGVEEKVRCLTTSLTATHLLGFLGGRSRSLTS